MNASASLIRRASWRWPEIVFWLLAFAALFAPSGSELSSSGLAQAAGRSPLIAQVTYALASSTEKTMLAAELDTAGIPDPVSEISIQTKSGDDPVARVRVPALVIACMAFFTRLTSTCCKQRFTIRYYRINLNVRTNTAN